VCVERYRERGLSIKNMMGKHFRRGKNKSPLNGKIN
jgi:hypothetical protein